MRPSLLIVSTVVFLTASFNLLTLIAFLTASAVAENNSEPFDPPL